MLYAIFDLNLLTDFKVMVKKTSGLLFCVHGVLQKKKMQLNHLNMSNANEARRKT